MWQDLRHGVRTLVKNPGFACVAGLVLALGIGLNTAIFSVVHAMLLKPLPVASPAELVYLYQVLPRQPDRPTVIADRHVDFFKAHADVFTDVTSHWGVSYLLRADDETDSVNVEWVLANYFDVLGVKPMLGRTLLPGEDDVSNPERAAVISHALWKRRFHADP